VVNKLATFFEDHPILVRVILILSLALVLPGWIVFSQLEKSLPQKSGEVYLAGIKNDVVVTRDKLGVVSIDAQTDEDAFFAHGYIQAQDRLWQMEIFRRTAQGRLSELFGRSSVDTDVWYRTLDVYGSSQSSLNHLSEDARLSLEYFTKGVNAFISDATYFPLEFEIFGMEVEPWSEADSLAVVKLFALMLSGNYKQEMSRLLATRKLNDSQLAEIFSPFSDHIVNNETKDRFRDYGSLQKLHAFSNRIEEKTLAQGDYIGSNAWVVSGKFTKSNQALVANDPHLNLQIPSLWYAVRLKGDELDVVGVTIPGLPVVVLGKNSSIAWAGTRMPADNQDLYFENTTGKDKSVYQVEDRWEKFETRTEYIDVKQDFPAFLRPKLKSVELTVRKTRNGPVISDIYDVFEKPVSLRATALDYRDTTFEAFFRLNYSSDWREFSESFNYHVSPNMNILYSDIEGNIGFKGVGNIPIRGAGVGLLPSPGWNDQFQWSGFIPKGKMPEEFNPSRGYIVNANNNTLGNDYPYFVSYDWAPPDRATRIENLLKQKMSSSKVTVQDFKSIQSDTLSLSSLELKNTILAVGDYSLNQSAIVDKIRAWDGNMRKSSPEASIYITWLKAIRSNLLRDNLGVVWGEDDERAMLREVSSNVTVTALVNILSNDTADLCDDITTDKKETCGEIVSMSLTEATNTLEKLKGADISDWKWGELNEAHYKHVPLSDAKLMKSLFERRAASGGAIDTVDIAGTRLEEGEGYLQYLGAGVRQIMSVGDKYEIHELINSTGQSGNVLSENYDDMIDLFHNMEFIDMSKTPSKDNYVLVLTGKRS